MAIESYRLKILQALTAHLEGIKPSEGFSYDLQGAVFRGRATFGANDPETMLSLLEAPRPDIGTYFAESNFRVEEWPLLLQGWTKDDPANPTDPLYTLMAEVENRLAAITRVRGDDGKPVDAYAYLLRGALGQAQGLTDFKFGPGVVRPATEGVSNKAFFYLPLQVGIARVVG